MGGENEQKTRSASGSSRHDRKHICSRQTIFYMHRRKILKSLPVISTLSISGCMGQPMPDYSEIPKRYSISLKPVHSPAVVANMREQEADVIPSPLILNLISALLDGNDVTRETRNFKLFKGSSHEKLFHYLEGESYYRINKKP